MPSPNWEDQIIYFIMTDRFFDGNQNNNDLGQSEYDLNDPVKFQGGDLEGIQQNLDYLQDLGITGVWITPPVLNQWWNPDKNFIGYHGYWASDFSKVDPHFGTLASYQALSKALHNQNMYLIQDVVTNHTGDYFRYINGYNKDSVTAFYHNYGQPAQPPFDQNDPNNPAHLKANIYHFTPIIGDYNNPTEILTGQLSDLDDLNTTHPLVRQTLGDAFRFWIKNVDVDGFRFDTPIYVEHNFWHSFLHNKDTANLGMNLFAQQLGKEKFYTFGETWVQSKPFETKADQRAASYLGSKDQPEMDGVLNFPLQQTIERVFTRGHSTDHLTYRLEQQKKLYAQPKNLVNFIDNHDMARFRTKGSEAAYEQAMLLMMSIPGVPVIYQGTEQGFTETRKNMFNELNNQSDAFLFIKKMIDFRKAHSATRNGKLEIIADSKLGNGLFLYRLKNKNETLYVAMNTLEETIIVNDLDLKMAGNFELEKVLSLTNNWKAQAGINQLNYLQLGGREGLVFKISESKTAKKITGGSIKINELKSSKVNDLTIKTSGVVAKADSVWVIVDGNFGAAKKAVLNDQIWKSTLDLRNLENGKHYYQALAYDQNQLTFSGRIFFDLELPIETIAKVNDLIGDDSGLSQKYVYPTDFTFKNQMDIKAVSMRSAGNNFTLAIEMANPISTVWKPTNGFDHVQFNVFIDLPNRKGGSFLPKQNAKMPNNLDWDYGSTINGWAITMFTPENATADKYGKINGSTPSVKIIPSKNIIELTFAASTIGRPKSLKGMKIYINTWDGAGEGGLRPLQPKAEAFTFGGGHADDPLIMDDVLIEY